MIDFHTHILPNQVNNIIQSFGNDEVFKEMFDNYKETSDYSKLLRNMSKNSISKSVILGYGWTNFEVLKMSNSYNLDCAKNNKELIPFCSVNPNFGKKSNDELERCISLGARGIGEIHPTVQNLEMTNLEIWKDTMQLALNADLPISIHCSEPVGHIYPGKGNTELNKMYEFIKLFPENKIVLSHWGGGLFFYELMKEVKELSRNVYYDTAATSYLYNEDIFEISIKIIGAEKILFGSDFPILNPSRVLGEMKNIGAKNIEKLTSSNAKFLLGLN